MASPSKEDDYLWAILGNSPLKHWHFEELLRETGMSRAALNKWLKRSRAEELLKRVKPKGHFPFFTAGPDNPVYQSKKKLFLLDKINEIGLIEDLLRSENVKVAIIFGSAARGDWYHDSDIDLFILGDISGIDIIRHERKLKREIEVHVFESRDEIRAMRSGLLKNIANGDLVKGRISDIAEVIA